MTPQTTAMHHIAINETIARYCISVDSKNFDLRNYFTPNVQADYPGPIFEGVNDVVALGQALQKSLANVSTHHALSTQSIKIAVHGRTASAVTYFICYHFGKGRWENQQLVTWGRFEDLLVRTENQVFSSTGDWLVRGRKVIVTNSVGDLGILRGEVGEEGEVGPPPPRYEPPAEGSSLAEVA